ILLYQGYSYRIRKSEESFEVWRCRNDKCHELITISKDYDIIRQKNHNHLQNYAENEALFLSRNLKEMAKNTEETPRNIINRCMKSISYETIKILPKYNNLRKKIGRAKRRQNIFLNNYTDISESLKYTEKGDLLYLYDSGINSLDRVIISATETNILHLCSCDTWIADGTFMYFPSNFYQLYTILGIYKGKSFPFCYFLMENKSQKAYEVGLNFLLSKCTKTPRKIINDFEQAAYLAISNIFFDCDVYGCFFHFSQNIYKNVLKNFLSKRYKGDSEFRLTVKIILSFAFIPIDSLNEIIVEFDKYKKK
ncbi:hypothetical protein DMUE_6074, partial [Dictyocoela muelleri]